jgi:hypothetical protein
VCVRVCKNVCVGVCGVMCPCVSVFGNAVWKHVLHVIRARV